MTEAEFIERVMPLQKSLYAFALSILRDESDAADCLQEVYTRLWEHRAKLASLENLSGYCTVAVKRGAIDIIRRRGRDVCDDTGEPPDIADTSPDPHTRAERRDDMKSLEIALEALPPRQRRVVEMSAISGLSNSQIEQATGLSGDNVRVLLSRGRKKLKELFEKR